MDPSQGTAPPRPTLGSPASSLGLHLGKDRRAGAVQDLLGFVQEASDPVADADTRWLRRCRRRHHRPVAPPGIGKPPLITMTVLGTPPRRLRRKIEMALPHRLPIGIRAALEVLALHPHRHSSSLEKRSAAFSARRGVAGGEGVAPTEGPRRPQRSEDRVGRSPVGDRTRPAFTASEPALGQEKDCPQPHVRWALGLVMANPAPCRPSL